MSPTRYGQPWAVSRKPELREIWRPRRWAVEMSTGRARYFGTSEAARQFIAKNPPPAVRDQLTRSLEDAS